MIFRRLRRVWAIHRAVRKYGLMEFAGKKPGNYSRPRGERLRLALEDLGPVFVKLGQALSTRPDLIPEDIAIELAKLQDQVPPFPGEQAKAIVERSLGKRIEEIFDDFDPVPIASASVAQVHAARLKALPHSVEETESRTSGEPLEVVVKVIRPGIEKNIREDVNLLYMIAELAEKFSAEARRIRPRAIVAEYEKIIFDELDLMREGANCSQLRRNWLGSELIYHPIVFWDYTRTDVLVMERIRGISIRELSRLRELGVDFRVLAERGVEIFFNQTFRDNFFHADMHPGNIFVDATDPQRPSYLAVDFGIVGTLTSSDQRYLAENFHAFFNRDYRRVAELHVESAWLPSNTRVEEFESAIRTVCEPIFQKPLKEISFGFFLLRLFQIARRFNYQVQPQLVLLQKTLLQIEGLGRQLYDDLDLWKTAKPIMEDWMRSRLSPVAALERVRAQLPILAETIPPLATQMLRRLERGESLIGGEGNDEEIKRLREEMKRGQRRTALMIAGSTLILAAAILLAFDGFSSRMLGNAPLSSWVLGIGGAVLWWRAGREQ
ncbi:MAG TPA: ubiquinone biosynthesis regulatory protein kinase UbiB [Nevskiaceae bacterium]|nr:ubiquinone biosynthesis regulatory protein kinase UbiB [Nevskiaceae bacterium]